MENGMFAAGILGIIVGAFLAVATAPNPANKEKCETYKVRNKVATAYVLKPPPAGVVYKACPQTTQKCEPVAESQSEPVVEEKPRKRRHHRVRRYWR